MKELFLNVLSTSRLVCPFSMESVFSLVPASVASGEVVTEWKNDYIGDVEIIYEDTKVYQEAVETSWICTACHPLV